MDLICLFTQHAGSPLVAEFYPQRRISPPPCRISPFSVCLLVSTRSQLANTFQCVLSKLWSMIQLHFPVISSYCQSIQLLVLVLLLHCPLGFLWWAASHFWHYNSCTKKSLHVLAPSFWLQFDLQLNLATSRTSNCETWLWVEIKTAGRLCVWLGR